MNEALRHVNRYKMLHVMIAHLSQDKTIETSHKSLLAKITDLAPKVFLYYLGCQSCDFKRT